MCLCLCIRNSTLVCYRPAPVSGKGIRYGCENRGKGSNVWINTSNMIKKELSIHYYEVDDKTMLPADEQHLVELARTMCDQAYAPYSAFYVGAAVLLKNGEIIKGSNQENGAYPSGLCAERVAAFAASAMFPGVPMQKIAISARSNRIQVGDPVSPCGACRQVLMEYELAQDSPMKIILSKEGGKIRIIEKVADLLPLSFSGNGLKIKKKHN